MMKSVIRNCCAVLLLLVVGSHAFTPAIDISRPNAVALNLHPKQAAELEACANDCYCAEAKALQNTSRRRSNDRNRGTSMVTSSMVKNNRVMNKRTPATARSTGPFAWCRRFISGSNRRVHT